MRIRRNGVTERNIIEWFASLPFVTEVPHSISSSSTRHLAVSCEALGISQTCLILHESRRWTRHPRLYVVMPGQLKTLAVLSGWFSSIAPMGDRRLKCRVEYEERERPELEAILLSAYSFTFPALAGAPGTAT